jgi:hypothetical protein
MLYLQSAVGLCGGVTWEGSPLKLMKALLVAALVLFAAGMVRADDLGGGDSRIVIGTQPGGSPSCSSFQESADSSGVISNGSGGPEDCINDGSAPITTLTFAVQASSVLGGALTCSSFLSTDLNWALSTSLIDDGTVDQCTLTAPATPQNAKQLLAYFATPGGAEAYIYAALSNTPPSLFNPLANDGDCDPGDMLFGIPVGCDVTFGNPGATGTQAFVADATFDVSPTGISGLAVFPEPNTLLLTLVGLAFLPFVRRRVAQRQ